MTQRREAAEALPDTPQSAGHPEAHAFARSLGGDVAVRDLLVAGALRGFSPSDLLPERAA